MSKKVEQSPYFPYLISLLSIMINCNYRQDEESQYVFCFLKPVAVVFLSSAYQLIRQIVTKRCHVTE